MDENINSQPIVLLFLSSDYDTGIFDCTWIMPGSILVSEECLQYK